MSAQKPVDVGIVPGIMRCAKCSFQLQRVTLYMGNGVVGPGDSKTEPCPNGCGPLWPITWEQHAKDAWAACERLGDELIERRARDAAVERLIAAAAKARRFSEASRPTAYILEPEDAASFRAALEELRGGV